MKLKELLALVDEIKRDMSYTRSLQERWQKEKKRFPILCEAISKQVDFFREKIEGLLDAEVVEEGVDKYVLYRLDVLRKKETVPVVELQTLEAAAKEAKALKEQREKEKKAQLAERVKAAMEAHMPKEGKSAEKLKALGEQVIEELSEESSKE